MELVRNKYVYITVDVIVTFVHNRVAEYLSLKLFFASLSKTFSSYVHEKTTVGGRHERYEI